MKAVSTVIGALMVLIITLVIAGIAYTYTVGVATQKIAVVLEIDPSTTTCSGTAIKLGIRNSGTNTVSLSALTISGTKPDGSAITPAACAATGSLNAGGRATCDPVTGGTGNNNIIVAGSGSSAQGVISCI